MTMSSFSEITAILVLAAVAGVAGLRLRQPLIIAFLAAGILAGPSGLGIIQSYDQIELFAHIGIAVLLFIVGLKLDLALIRTTGAVALATGLGQVVFTSIIGFFIALALGMDAVSAAYVAVALTFSSTIIIVKLLSDKKEIDSLHGRIALGFLIVQDIMAILALIGLATFDTGRSAQAAPHVAMALVIVKVTVLILGIGILMRYVLPGLLKRLAASSELLILFAITWALLVSALCDRLGLSKEVGAFLAGISLASTEYRDAIGARLVTLRDFLLVFFFIDLGARMEWSAVGDQLGQASIFSLFVLVGNPLIVLAIMGAMGYRRRTGFLAGLTVAQISEFSLIVAAAGLALGHISPQTMGLITLVGVVTILASTYMILYSGRLYEVFSPWLGVFERSNPYREAQCNDCFVMPRVDVVLVGLGGYGRELAENLLERGRQIIGVDFDPQALDYCRSRGIPVLYGDMGDPETHDGLPLAHARWVVSTVRNPDVDLQLLRHLREKGYTGRVALTARTKEEAELYLRANPHVVLRPFLDAAEQGADALTGAWHDLYQETDWPVSFREIRIKTGSAFAGHAIRDVPLRSEAGVSIVAVSRAGRVSFNPDPDFQLFPSDRIVIMGPPEDLRQAEALIHRVVDPATEEETGSVSLVEARVPATSAQAGRTLEQTGFRQVYGATVIGIRRGKEYLMSPGPGVRLEEGDVLLVMGTADSFEQLRQDFEL
ncbi:MAG TPA: cation:proton antiporter [Deltaproteobacteria bacterium]|nr:cation:proton antiporter [Deltaproteobacteria bacterium]